MTIVLNKRKINIRIEAIRDSINVDALILIDNKLLIILLYIFNLDLIKVFNNAILIFNFP